ncbi:MAG: ComEA family DNA-binding protein [Thermomonas sp.]|uniref:ComEA family DNA-binding protein n=1 Tax=Thermomonas sp. TaxID=1971895 RepID=UPI001EBFC5A1|nr:ComEA family DNA-binding protein [Thermomonas sp.]MBV2209083.1 ComEA family DNA-binding protein [Thermomonas sp.]
MRLFTSIAIAVLLVLAMAGRAAASEKVNINTADAATLDRVLLNIGPAKAQAIVEYRTANGAFRSPEQLALVKGIGLKTVEKNRDRIVINSQRTVVRAATPLLPVPAYVPPAQVARR